MPKLDADEPATFTCEMCHGTFPKARSDAEALAEAKDEWDEDLGDDVAQVCHDCWLVLTKAHPIAEYRRDLHG